MKKLFSFNLYLDALKRIRILSIVFFAISVFSTVTVSLSYLLPLIYSEPYGHGSEALSLIDLFGSAVSYVFIFTPVIAIFSLSYLFKRNESDFYEALPYSRGARLVSSALAVITVSVLTVLITSGVGVAILTPCIGRTVEYRALRGFVELLGLILCSVVSVGAATLAVSVSGTLLNSFVVYAALTFAPRNIMGLIKLSIEMLSPTVTSGYAIRIFGSGYNMLTDLSSSSMRSLISPTAFVYTFILGCVYASLSYLLFTRRKSERATHSFAFNIFRHITSVLIALTLVSCGIYLITLDVWLISFAVFLFAISVGVYFAYSLVTGRKDGALSSLKAFPILIGASAVVALTVFLASAAFNSYSPTKDEIKSISVFAPETEDWYHHITYSEYVDKRAGNIILTDQQSKQILSNAIARGVERDRHTKYVTVSFKINTGFDSYRTLYLTEEEYSSIISTLAANEEYEELWLNVGEGASNVSVHNMLVVEGEDAEAILDTLMQEVREMGFDKWFSAYRDAEELARLQYYIELDGQTLIVSLPITEQTPKTYALFLEKERIATEKLLSDMKAALESCVSGTGDELYVSFNFTTEDKTTYWIESEMSVGDRDKQLLYLEILGLLSADSVSYEDDTVYVNINCDDFLSDHYYGSFKASPENLDRLTEIFEKYGETYRFE